MAAFDKTPEQIKEDILSRFSTVSTVEGAYTNTIVAPVSYEIWKAYAYAQGYGEMIFPNENSGEYIDIQAAQYDIRRKDAAKATVKLTFTGSAGLQIPAGTRFRTGRGLEYILDSTVSIGESGTASGTATAAQTGTEFNVPAGQITAPASDINGLTKVESEEATGGIDRETDAELVQRYYQHLRKPPTSGNVQHYKEWALEVPGVTDAKVFPLWAGPGTVKVVLLGQNSRGAEPEVVAAAEAHIRSERPIGADVTVVSATEVDVTVSAEAVLDGNDLANVKAAFQASIEEYFKTLAFGGGEIVSAELVARLMEVDGVYDCKSMLIDGSAGNLSLSETDVPVLTEVSVVEAG